jgi:SpoVK/Ycf46/Vps4 family AAA+-type ATPase
MNFELKGSLDVLSLYVLIRRPIIYIEDNDFADVDRLLLELAKKFGVIDDKIERNNVHEFNIGDGYVHFDGNKKKRGQGIVKTRDFLGYFSTEIPKEIDSFLILKDIHKDLDSPDVSSKLKNLALLKEARHDFNFTIFIVSAIRNIPTELEEYVTIFEPKAPEENEILEKLKSFCKEESCKEPEENKLKEIALSLKGLSRYEIDQVVSLAYAKSEGSLDGNETQLCIISEKEQRIQKSGILENITVSENDADIGGLKNLVDYLHDKSKIYKKLAEAKRFGVDSPKGILIVGITGCGKSLTAKVTSKLFGVPLLRLDVGKLMGKYVGESEANLRKAIRTSEAVSPCILWIDEIEKAFAGIGGTGGASDISTRLFGNVLTWLQDKKSSVFVVATANDIDKLPPEFLRKGRFDEIFFVDLPNEEERRMIFEIHLKKRKQKNVSKLVSNTLIRLTKNFSGAEIESVVKSAVEMAFLKEIKNKEQIAKVEGSKNHGAKEHGIDDHGVTFEDLKKPVEETKPLFKTMKTKITRTRKKLEAQFRNASE